MALHLAHSQYFSNTGLICYSRSIPPTANLNWRMSVKVILSAFPLTLLFASFSILTGWQDKSAEAASNFEIKHDGAMVLALSWQPGFCETRPRLRECKSQKEGRYDVANFSLHGLWPQPRRNSYCGVSEGEISKSKNRRWKRLADLELPGPLKQKLSRIMPGSASFLQRHQWIKHGTCYSKSAEVYFRDSLALMDVVNASPVQRLFKNSIGRRLSGGEIRKTFDEAFGEGVGERVRVACKRDGERIIIVEITLGLKGLITDNLDVGKLALASPKTNPGCPAGIVDPVGLQ